MCWGLCSVQNSFLRYIRHHLPWSWVTPQSSLFTAVSVDPYLKTFLTSTPRGQGKSVGLTTSVTVVGAKVGTQLRLRTKSYPATTEKQKIMYSLRYAKFYLKHSRSYTPIEFLCYDFLIMHCHTSRSDHF